MQHGPGSAISEVGPVSLTLMTTVVCCFVSFVIPACDPGQDELAWIGLDAASDFACALRNDGHVACWGDERYGVTEAPQLPGTRLVAVAGVNGCSLSESGIIDCWGSDEYGLLATPDGIYSHFDVSGYCGYGVNDEGVVASWGGAECPTTTDEYSLVSASLGCDYACGLQEDGTAGCWGDAEHGEDDPPEERFIAIDSKGWWVSLGVTEDGNVSCWGAYCGGLPSGEFVSTNSYMNHSCALDVNGNLECWGEDIGGETSPPQDDFADVAVGQNFACGITLDGELACWGCERTCPFEDGCGSYDWGQCDPPSLEDE